MLVTQPVRFIVLSLGLFAFKRMVENLLLGVTHKPKRKFVFVFKANCTINMSHYGSSRRQNSNSHLNATPVYNPSAPVGETEEQENEPLEEQFILRLLLFLK
jgi:hypothetical protein